ncbi:PTS sugar transporter subunit IIA [Clostridium botulinum]|uniref:Ascorbate-specific PTS system EIIA component n=1 Tax=Clostridium botulinum C/D str. DC5 TaxID=1443128 RepID=A0A0A0II98_CLOBO|nr:PTS sugar transporter subunit IIA [Clostridium botulinum]KEI07173.1 PTS system mannitol-specific transporter subunit IIA [Clostridium botulinum C/D str. BKT75002]KEI08731.1 PTS system mannitol-specific transporter subunit IIA [Clostridium botulinum C/D str. BKT2873]KGM96459.1 PTS system mannitol-specific transporter subunit IIA [Clostridium botulinum D str. CCUG 7971]KGN00683.1 PTS system mannitol-specific transporter subunit IIA [Clostridium botulinum C/D str. DC5]KOC45761.1 PTS mannitol t
MLSEIITPEVIKLNVECNTWEEAINIGADILVQKGYVEKEYEEAILNKLKELGPYMVITPQIVVPHARPEDGVNKTSISLVTLKNSISFGNDKNDPVKLIITIASENNRDHIQFLSEIVDLLRNKEDLEKIFNAEDKSIIIDILKKYN